MPLTQTLRKVACRSANSIPIIRKVRGATLAEYAMVAGFIAVVSLGGVIATGTGVATVFCTASSKIDEYVNGAERAVCDEFVDPSEEPDAGPEIVIPDTYKPVSENVILFYEGTTASFVLTASSGMIDWGDGTQQAITSGTKTYTHSYAEEGRYRVVADGVMTAFANKDTSTLREVRSFGTVGFTSLAGAFAQVEALESVAALPDTVTNISGIFQAAVTVPTQIETWNVSQVENASSAFEGVGSIGANIAYWDMSNVTNMSSMFKDVADLDLDLSLWDVSGAQNLSYLFAGVTSFDQDLSMWNTSSAVSMEGMFQNASYFNQPLASWDVSGVQNFGFMFDGASSFDQPLNKWDVSAASPGGVTNRRAFTAMFRDAAAFNQPLGSWDLSGLVHKTGSNYDTHNLDEMFSGASSFEQSLASWCVDAYKVPPEDFSVGSMMISEPLWGRCGTPDFEEGVVLAYRGGEEVSITISGGGTAIDWGDGSYHSVNAGSTAKHILPAGDRVEVRLAGGLDSFRAPGDALLEVVSFGSQPLTSLESAFTETGSLERVAMLPATVTNLGNAFAGSAGTLEGVETWDTAGVTSLIGTFANTVNFNRPIGDWDVSNVLSFQRTFSGASSFNQPLNDWDVSGARRRTEYGRSFTEMFMDASAFNQPLDQWDVDGVIAWYTSAGWIRYTYNMDRMFKGASSFEQSLASWCVSSHPQAPAEFSVDSPMISTPLWGQCGNDIFDDGIVLAYRGGEEVTITLGGVAAIDWGDGSYHASSTSASATHVLPEGERVEVRIAGGATSFQAPGEALLEVVSFGSEPLTSLASAFTDTDNLAKLAAMPVTVTDLNYAFSGSAGALEGVEFWDTSNVTTLVGTFSNTANFDRPIGAWDVSNVKKFQSTFSGAMSFNQPLNDWDVSGGLRSAENGRTYNEMFMNAAAFNQPLNKWDLSGVRSWYSQSGWIKYTYNMDRMFKGAASFEQSLADWCMGLHPSAPDEFSVGSPMISEPIWGQCGTGAFEDGIVLAYRGGEEVTITLAGSSAIQWGDGAYHASANGASATHTLPEGDRVEVRIAGGATGFTASGDALLEVVSFGNEPLTSLAGAFEDTDNLASLAALPSTVTNLNNTFSGSGGSLAGVEAWGTGNVTTMTGTFRNAANFNRPIGSWDVGSVTSFDGTFSGASSFNQPLNSWDVSKAQRTGGGITASFREMFMNATAFNQPLDQWDVSGVVYQYYNKGYIITQNFDRMFKGASSFNQSLADWCVNKHSPAPEEFATGSAILNEPLWGYCGVPSFDEAIVLDYRGGEEVEITLVGSGVIDWGDGTYHSSGASETASKVLPAGDHVQVRLAGGLTSFQAPGDALLEVVSFGSEPITHLASSFTETDNLAQLAALPASVVGLGNTFAGSGGTLAGVEAWDTSRVTGMTGTFSGAWNFNRPIASWDVSQVKRFAEMFSGASAFNQPIGGWDVSGATRGGGTTSNGVTASFRDMFRGAVSFNQPLGNWNMKNVAATYYWWGDRPTHNLSGMFYGASSFAQDLSGWCMNAHKIAPAEFAVGSAIAAEPVWGSCPAS